MIILYAHFSKPPEKLANGGICNMFPRAPRKEKEEEEGRKKRIDRELHVSSKLPLTGGPFGKM